MKTKCKTLKLSIMLTIISFLFFSIFFLVHKKQDFFIYEYVYNLFLALFGSSFVVFLISIAEYRVAKIQLLERIWNESRILNFQLYKIRPLYTCVDNKVMLDYINEWLFRQNDEDKLLFKNKHKAYDKIYDYFYKCNKKSVEKMKPEKVKPFIDSLIKKEREQVLEKLEKTIDLYLNLNNYNFNEFNNLLGDVQFFIHHKSQNLKLYQNIYNPLRNMYNKLKVNVCRHFELYRNGENYRLDVLLSILFSNQDNLFRVEKSNDNESIWYSVYADFCDNIADKIEEFRAKTIYKCNEEAICHYPIETKCYRKT